MVRDIHKFSHVVLIKSRKAIQWEMCAAINSCTIIKIPGYHGVISNVPFEIRSPYIRPAIFAPFSRVSLRCFCLFIGSQKIIRLFRSKLIDSDVRITAISRIQTHFWYLPLPLLPSDIPSGEANLSMRNCTSSSQRVIGRSERELDYTRSSGPSPKLGDRPDSNLIF